MQKVDPKDLPIWQRIVEEMRDEHDRGDGHFSTEEVEMVEKFIAESSK